MFDYTTMQSKISRKFTTDENATQANALCMKQVPLAESELTIFLDPMIALLCTFIKK